MDSIRAMRPARSTSASARVRPLIAYEFLNSLAGEVGHRELPVEGVQFHPESILTEHGHALLKNFLER